MKHRTEVLDLMGQILALLAQEEGTPKKPNPEPDHRPRKFKDGCRRQWTHTEMIKIRQQMLDGARIADLAASWGVSEKAIRARAYAFLSQRERRAWYDSHKKGTGQ